MKTTKALTIANVCLCIALLFTLASKAHADTKTAQWTNATLNTDGTTIPAPPAAGSLVRTTIEYGTCNAGKTAIASKVGEIQANYPMTSVQVPLVVIQEYCLDAWHSNTYATTFAPSTAATVVTGNSVRSNVVITQSVPPQPAPPAGVTVGNFVAYQLVPADGNVTLLAFGTVKPGAHCDMTHSVDDGHGPMYLVPDWRNDVLMPNGTPNTTRQTVFASCG